MCCPHTASLLKPFWHHLRNRRGGQSKAMPKEVYRRKSKKNEANWSMSNAVCIQGQGRRLCRINIPYCLGNLQSQNSFSLKIGQYCSRIEYYVAAGVSMPQQILFHEAQSYQPAFSVTIARVCGNVLGAGRSVFIGSGHRRLVPFRMRQAKAELEHL